MLQKTITLLRGCPGSGKSTFAHWAWSNSTIVEADQYFVGDDGVYRFDGTKLKDAHAWCRDKVEKMMKSNQQNSYEYLDIVVSNTFTRAWEMEEYYKLAEQYGYRVFSLIVENRHNGKNVHGVPEDKVQQMRDRFEVQL